MIRRICALGALLALFLQGSSGGHMLLVEHARCAEHGELVHEGGAHHHHGAGHPETEAPAFHGASDADFESAHEHCTLSSDRREAAVVVDGCLALARIDEPVQSFSLARSVVLSNANRFRVAPKNSPPA